ncbi:MAG: hypothetical protein HKN74_05255 [Acidimicrobiia bacterium]|nr:hypothetical protein [Acidimicrobiia bacterium]NNF09675.1 hypothetical protein [Acidimicrobiia bacterium]NNL68772.1 hypothetical protein [Acidimicrobiia bacterium]
MTGLHFHSEGLVDRSIAVDEYVGSPLYYVIAEHEAGVAAAVLLVAGAWWLRRRARRGSTRAGVTLNAYRSLSPLHRLLAWMLLLSSAIHAGLVLGHEPSVYSVLYAAGAGAFFLVARRLINAQPWRRWTRLVLVGSIVGYTISSVAGSAPDQLGMATKLIELVALGIAFMPRTAGRLRALAATAGTVVFVVIAGLGGWIGAFASGAGGHHLGEVPPPGVLLPPGEDRPPTEAERRSADALYAATVAAVAKYQDPAVAAAAGYAVGDIYGRDYHAPNEAFKNDGHVFDPERPENLIYAESPAGPVLIGVMYEMDEIGVAGPAVGGPLTVWHAHDHVCFSLTPPALAGLTSPFGYCPAGSITMPITNEMIHLWTLPGVPEQYGELEDAWLDAYLGSIADGG